MPVVIETLPSVSIGMPAEPPTVTCMVSLPPTFVRDCSDKEIVVDFVAVLDHVNSSLMAVLKLFSTSRLDA